MFLLESNFILQVVHIIECDLLSLSWLIFVVVLLASLGISWGLDEKLVVRLLSPVASSHSDSSLNLILNVL